MVNNAFDGFMLTLEPTNLIAVLIGSLVGTLVGVLPGLGPTATMAILLPLTYNMGPTAGMIMLAGIWYGAQYGGSTTSILVNVPGEAASVVTTLDGYQMARKGRAGAALAVAALGSFVAGTISIVGLQFFAPVLANAALSFGAPEYFGLTVLGLLVLSNLTGKSPTKAMIMAVLGIMLACVGLDPVVGVERFTFDSPELLGGFGFVPVTLGLFGLTEILDVVAGGAKGSSVIGVRFRELYPTLKELRRGFPPMIRGGLLGFLVGLVPGPSATIASFVAYAVERKSSSHPEEFGKGAIEGVAGPEAANNAACAGGLVPLLALGLPFAPPTAVLLGGMMIHGVTPGPLLMQKNPELFWGVIGSMYLGNIILIILNLPLVGLFASITRIPSKYLLSVVLVFCMVGAFGENNSLVDVWVLLGFGALGFLARRLGFEPAPLILGLVLGRVMERNFRQALTIMNGDLFGFWGRPISAVLLTAALIVLIAPFLLKVVLRRDVGGFVQED